MELIFPGHKEDCTPSTPCKTCEAVAFLRLKLSRKNFDHVADLLELRFADPAVLALEIEDLGFNTRINNCLKCEEIHTVPDLLRKTEIDLLKVPNLGAESLATIREKLQSLCLYLKKTA